MGKKKKKIGRPSKYKAEFIEQAKSLAALGMTDGDLATHFKIHKDNFTDWKKRYPAFAAALIEGKLNGEMSMTKALFQTGTKGNVLAQEFWLCNRAPEKWRHTQRIEHEVRDVTSVELIPAAEFLKKKDG